MTTQSDNPLKIALDKVISAQRRVSLDALTGQEGNLIESEESALIAEETPLINEPELFPPDLTSDITPRS